MVLRSRIIGCGGYLPDRIMTNDELSGLVDTTDEWITGRSGIRQRHIAAEGELTSDLAVNAAKAALKDAGISVDDIDLIVLATATPDETFPSTATRVQAKLGMTRGAAFDVQAVCTGFIYALTVADNFIRTGQAKTVLVIGAETFTRILDWKDRGTCVLFGDGAGAVILRAGEGEGSTADQGILSTHIHSDGRDHDCLYVDGGPSSTGTSGHVRMQGQEIFKKAVLRLAEVAKEALDHNGLTGADLDWLVPHQANLRIMRGTTKKLGVAEDKLIVTIDRHANTSAASIPLAIADAHGAGKFSSGDLILLEGIGGGLTWGACLLRW
ncbi:MAG: ketoacyl-ACP synthase III [Rhodospirillaceae bacterium]|jgi:3-oxoacyl-[acyl-carrier-protein] synthase III|nr:ketoacyl-ACP synthase III [Rhodospirillaceae bacterium]